MTKIKPTTALHINIGQLRIDTWNSLKNEAAKLATSEKGTADCKKHLNSVEDSLKRLGNIERYFAFPGFPNLMSLKETCKQGEYVSLLRKTNDVVQLLVSDAYRNGATLEGVNDWVKSSKRSGIKKTNIAAEKNYFEVLFVEDLSEVAETELRQRLLELQDKDEQFVYRLIVVPSFQDALIALSFNHNIQSVVVRYGPVFYSKHITTLIQPFIENVLKIDLSEQLESDLGPLLGKYIRQFRPELNTYYITDTALTHLKDSTLNNFNRIFYRKEDVQELHLSIIGGISERFKTPFFSALVDYSKKPTGVFHAMPVSRGNSVFKSNWIKDFGRFYGRNMFLAETSSTTGGLDSLLQPTGPLKKAQEMAAKAYGSEYTFFVTNGTSTANKIVQQALVEPGDVVFIDRDCHKSHHYGLVLAGAFPVYLDSYPIQEYSMYGAVPLKVIKEKLLEMKAIGKLDMVKMLLLTNCTFDGLVYNVEKVMEEVLAIKPDMIFLWDEAWFAFAGFTYTYKQRTGMFVAKKLYAKYHSEAYKLKYEKHVKSLAAGETATLPNPDKVKIRVYSTQSTHKTLSSFRQGSMIHIWDEDFQRKTTDAFHEAYMTHTSTSPNYQILASLDAGRRQVQFEGYELVEKSIEMAMVMRAKINDHPLLKKYFEVLTIKDLIPLEYRGTGISEYYSPKDGWTRMEEAWSQDEFALDPTKITLSVGKAGIDGDTFKNEYLMDQFNIQINKTSRNTVLLMTNIGTTRSSVAYLMNALLIIAKQLDENFRSLNQKELEIAEKRIHSLMEEYPPLPDFSHFHHAFQAGPDIPGGNIRAAYFLSYHEDECEYVPLENCLDTFKDGRELVSASFVIPYPPGFPVLVPGQVVSEEIIHFMLALDVSEIHGFRPELGLKIFTASAISNRDKVTGNGVVKKEAMKAIANKN
ncbi:MAG: aminotransferase class I/II-fold pyridoxal phosphate-dependent enzyme [Saprospiraceae bacterium]|nr:aminotransferase class I/II-fold pyridoxal phosphate-dependent enzyme [Saprospiraceae bacterium]MCF8250024.1 aminotransferase class I/II-fold pyridoxal phosphate-dependent enzyme [Saprospiraceae bacterium]MCF8278936.1 aminotransferase class I/II-fold pyridoxal phosphate-dependent enzyme [Bacteroidales bacterium]MCF8311037.1 aminotransferase class I/II-fold pyridoxal phosphate-dependent enzyme [Saprospiraceae bacterium]MCF8439627.1 aminotransferase class I/II-fold pyridoxal phosphate-dependen